MVKSYRSVQFTDKDGDPVVYHAVLDDEEAFSLFDELLGLGMERILIGSTSGFVSLASPAVPSKYGKSQRFECESK